MDKHNLTIQRLAALVADKKVKESVTKLIEVAIETAAFCRDWRNRHIAHRDLQLSMNAGVKPLKVASRSKVKTALEAIASVMNAISLHYMDATIMFDVISEPHGALDLLYVIDDGLRARKEKHKRIKAGKYLPDDYKKRDL